MRKIYLMMCLLAMSVAPSMAQRYLEEIFTDVEVTSNVVYGVNATVLYVPQLGQAVPEELKMDIYQPVGDTETNRPILLYFHSGNFLPFPFNGGTGGSKTDSATVEICTRFARMGYVVASCDYRMGWNPLAPTQPERTFTLINAAYRGVQDCRTAVRYMRKSVAEESNPYGVDITRVAVWGQGTGGYIAFAAATLDNWQEDIAQIEKFNWDPTGSGVPVPMVAESVNGNADGTSYGVYLGDTLCYPNHTGYTSDFNVMVNMGGAMGEISWLENPSIPMISFHVPTDPFAPYQTGTVVVPTTDEQVVEVAGSYAVQAMANAFSSNAVFQLADNYEAGLPFTNAANQGNNGFYGLCPIFRTTAPPAFDSSPWDWWNADAIAAFDAANGTSNNANNLAQNPDMSATKARTFIDTIQGYAAPRIMCALQLPGSPCELISGCTAMEACNYNPDAAIEDFSCLFPGDPCDDGNANSVNDVYNSACECEGEVSVYEVETTFVVYPNPSEGLFTITNAQGAIVNLIEVFDITGKRVVSMNPMSSTLVVDMTTMPRGMYTIKIQSANSVQTIRVQRI